MAAETTATDARQQRIDQIAAEFDQVVAQLRRALAATPDDRINWSPSATARTPAQIAAHAAGAVHNLNEMMDGRPFGQPDTAAADALFLEQEKSITTRAQVEALIDQHCNAFRDWLGKVSPERLSDPVTFPFGMGQGTVDFAMIFPALHMRGHIAQIDYVQTIYGDRVWH